MVHCLSLLSVSLRAPSCKGGINQSSVRGPFDSRRYRVVGTSLFITLTTVLSMVSRCCGRMSMELFLLAKAPDISKGRGRHSRVALRNACLEPPNFKSGRLRLNFKPFEPLYTNLLQSGVPV